MVLQKSLVLTVNNVPTEMGFVHVIAEFLIGFVIRMIIHWIIHIKAAFIAID
jgi:hypothetical protein